MGVNHDSAREELEVILGKLQDIHRQTNPGSVTLFSESGQSFTVQDVARYTSLLRSQPTPERTYTIYSHNSVQGNTILGDLGTRARMGQIEVDISEAGKPDFGFRMNVGFGSRVINYDVKGSSGDYVGHHTQATLISALEQYLGPK